MTPNQSKFAVGAPCGCKDAGGVGGRGRFVRAARQVSKSRQYRRLIILDCRYLCTWTKSGLNALSGAIETASRMDLCSPCAPDIGVHQSSSAHLSDYGKAKNQYC